MAEEPTSTLPPPAKVSRQRTSSISDDYNVYKTNEDATESKKAAVGLGYWRDSFVDMFCHTDPQRKDPEINRGYWARVAAVEMLVDRFLQMCGPCSQVVSLGCGFDTLYWRLTARNAQFSNYVEVDFSSVTAKKIHHIMKPPGIQLRNAIASDESQINISSHVDLHGPRYHLLGADLRQHKELSEKLSSAKLNLQAPTLVLCECVLIYMASEKSHELIEFLANALPTAAFVNYEQVNLDDKFGEVMQENLSNRGICLAGTKPCESVESQKKRFESAGWTDVKVWPMSDIYNKYLPKEEVIRIERLEFLDEKELLNQLLDHYCIVFASKDQKGLGLKSINLA